MPGNQTIIPTTDDAKVGDAVGNKVIELPSDIYPSSSFTETCKSLELLKSHMGKATTVAEIATLHAYQKALLLKYEVLKPLQDASTSSTNTVKTILESKYKPPAGITPFVLGKNLKKYIKYIEKICKRSGSVPDAYIINVLSINIPDNSEIDIFIDHKLIDKNKTWDQCKTELLDAFNVSGAALKSLFELFAFTFNTTVEFDQEKARFLDLLLCSDYDTTDSIIPKLFLFKLPSNVYESLNASYQLDQLNTWESLMDAVDKTHFRLQASRNSSQSHVSSVSATSAPYGDVDTASAIAFYANAQTKYNINKCKVPCINHFCAKECTKSPCGFSHDPNNLSKVVKFASQFIKQQNSKHKASNDKNKASFFLTGLHSFAASKLVDTAILDSGSNITIINDSRLLTNIQPMDDIKVLGLSDSTTVTCSGNFGALHNVHCVNSAPLIILSLSHLVESGYTVHMNSTYDQFSISDNSNNKLIFHKLNGLYTTTRDNVLQFFKVNSVTTMYVNNTNPDNQLQTNQRITKKEAIIVNYLRRLHLSLSHPGKSNFIQTLKNGCIKLAIDIDPSCVTKYVEMMYSIYPCGPCLNSNSFMSQAPSDDFYATTIGAKVHCDIFFVTQQFKFLISVDELTQLTMIRQLSNKSSGELLDALKSMINQYEIFSHKVKHIYSDAEATFLSITDNLHQLRIRYTACSPQNHNPVVEKKVNHIRHKIVAILHSLSFHLPQAFVGFMIMWIIQSVNIVSTSNTNISPRMLFTNEQTKGYNLDVQFGEIVMCKTPNRTNKLDSKLDIGIVVARELDSQGCVTIYNLDSRTFQSRRELEKLSNPMSPNLLKSIDDALNHLPRLQYKLNRVLIKALTDNIYNDPLAHITHNVPINTHTVSQANPHTDNDEHFEITSISNTLTQPAHPQEQIQLEDILPADDQDSDSESDWLYPVDLLYKVKTGRGFRYMVHYRGYDSSKDELLPRTNLTGFSDSELQSVPLKKDYELQIGKLDEHKQPSESTQVSVEDPIQSHAALFAKVCFTNISLKKSLTHNESATMEAAYNELLALHDLGTFSPILPSDITRDILGRCVLAFFFFKEKRNNQNILLKYKGRLVANGARQPSSTYDPSTISCPTVHKPTMMSILNIATYYDYETFTCDIGNAFLESSITTDVYVKLDQFTSKLLCKVDPAYTQYMNSNNMITCKLVKSLYGLVQSPSLFFNHLSTILQTFGLKATNADPCCFVKRDNNGTMYIISHIDDLLICTSNTSMFEQFQDYMNSCFTKVSWCTESNNFEYLGLNIQRDRIAKTTKINQLGFINKITELYKINTPSNYPYLKRLDPKDNQLITDNVLQYQEIQKLYLKKLMKAQYLTSSRIDIMTSISYLASHVHNIHKYDIKQLDELYKYIFGTKQLQICLHPESMNLVAYADASYGSHVRDSFSQSGIIVSFGEIKHGYTGIITASSTKQKHIVKSSFESELMSIDKVTDELIWTRKLLEELGISQTKPSIIYNDNKSTITSIHKGTSSFKQTKHINTKYFYIREHIQNNQINLQYIETENNLADFLTKPLQGSLFIKFRNAIMNVTE